MKRELRFWWGQTELAPVAIFRIVFGLLTVNWFWQLYPNLTQFFTDEGMFPRSSQVLFFPLHFTLLNVAGDRWEVVALWVLSVAAAAALAVGFRTRTAAILTFVLLGSFSLRDPMIGDASDQVFRASAFWLSFTAAGDRYSLDAWLRAGRGDPPSGRGWALPVRLLELQFAWIYLATGLEKMGGGLWRDGLAVFYSLQLEHTFARPWALPLAMNVDLTRIATQLTVAVELAFLPLAFLPPPPSLWPHRRGDRRRGPPWFHPVVRERGQLPVRDAGGTHPLPTRSVARRYHRESTVALRARSRRHADAGAGWAAPDRSTDRGWRRTRRARAPGVLVIASGASRRRAAGVGGSATPIRNLLQKWNMFAPIRRRRTGGCTSQRCWRMERASTS